MSYKINKLDVKKLKFCFSLILVLLLFFNFANAVVEVFSKYDTNFNISSNGEIDVVKDLTLKNVYDTGVVPGQIYFEIGHGAKNDVFMLKEDSVSAVDEFGNKINFHIRKTDNFTSIVLDIYYPLLPGFEYNFKLNYDLIYKSNGIFFRNIYIPLRESTIPIENGSFKVILPSKYSFTYLKDSDDMKNLMIDDNVATWDIINDVPSFIGFEYSYIPIRFGNVRGSMFFWVGVNLLLFFVLLWEIKKEIRRVRDGGEKKSKFGLKKSKLEKKQENQKEVKK